MSRCVPDCDASSEDISANISSAFPVPSGKVSWDAHQLRKPHIFDLSYGSAFGLSDFDLLVDGEYLTMMPQTANYKKHLSDQVIDELEYANSSRTTRISKDGSPNAFLSNVVAVDDQACRNATADDLAYSCSSIDDDMLAYLYPLDIPSDRAYCCNTFSEVTNDHKDLRSEQSPRGGIVRVRFDPFSLEKAPDAIVAPDDARASFQPHSEQNGSSNVQATKQHPVIYKSSWAQNVQPTVDTTVLRQSSSICYSAATVPSPMLPPKLQPVSSPASKSLPAVGTSVVNFPYFSRPAALAKASLQTLAMSTSCISPCMHQQSQQLPKVDVGESVAIGTTFEEITIGAKSPILCPEEVARSLACFDAQTNSSPQQSLCGYSSMPSSRDSAIVNLNMVPNRTRAAGTENQNVERGPSNLTCSLVDEGKKSPSAPENMEAREPSSTTCSGGSGNITKKSRKTITGHGKRKAIDSQHRTESQSIEADNESCGLKKSVEGRKSKRSRAAEVHNLSEQRRRDRINEKMKALQELIPNSNKTDKASMLDEAVEYLKMLQLQLQVPNVRVGERFGMGLGMDMGMMGMTNTGSVGHVLPLPLSGSYHNVLVPSATSADSHKLFTSTGVLDCNKNIMSCPQLQPLNTELYQAYLQHQQQQTHSQPFNYQIQPYRNA
ncbi:hypothetical protein O6H91_04G005300 [Diphasiastrum complanatum]|uniref:Uncharacterized protein n=2 Tax=Diphasiastrum complanatum TaxID=34168 RepID=A0ACC2DTY2_DIPCM|nr:hypothetical protein O6H91_04G005000 [Diphasiastrum complanatum]KAJ7557684.1 hypothetical protein O6H91_04G005300 [Diphasiastrum complanatum]